MFRVVHGIGIDTIRIGEFFCQVGINTLQSNIRQRCRNKYMLCFAIPKKSILSIIIIIVIVLSSINIDVMAVVVAVIIG